MEYNIYYQNLIFIPAIAFVVTVFIKGFVHLCKTGKIDVSRAVGSGGMPSVHSSVIVSLTAALALKHGIQSDYFAIAMALTAIIIYDALNVRFEAGQHAVAINKILKEKQFKESLGHLPSEAIVGSIVGILVALALFHI